jgi:hypothetical protein
MRYFLTFLCSIIPTALMAEPPADPPTLKIGAVIAGNMVFNSGTPVPTFDVPAGAAMGSLDGDGLPSDGGLTLTARQTKVGLQLFQRIDENTTASGLTEIDFFGLHENAGPGGVIQTTPRLRLAYGALKHGAFEVRGGQDWSVVSPRTPSSAGHMSVVLHSFGGAIWNRVPQLTLRGQSAGDSSFGFAVSAVRSHSGDAAAAITRFEGPEPGTSSQIPAGQARIFWKNSNLEFGLAGHFASEKYATLTGDVSVPSWLGSADVFANFAPVAVAGQGYCGENINGLFSRAGVKRTVDTNDAVTDVEGLGACGGWLEVKVTVGPVSAIASGSGEFGDEETYGANAAYQQWDAFGAVALRPWKPFEVSLEYLRTTTSYKGAATGINDSISLNTRFFFDGAIAK